MVHPEKTGRSGLMPPKASKGRGAGAPMGPSSPPSPHKCTLRPAAVLQCAKPRGNVETHCRALIVATAAGSWPQAHAHRAPQQCALKLRAVCETGCERTRAHSETQTPGAELRSVHCQTAETISGPDAPPAQTRKPQRSAIARTAQSCLYVRVHMRTM